MFGISNIILDMWPKAQGQAKTPMQNQRSLKWLFEKERYA
jgi:hypothetical protein